MKIGPIIITSKKTIKNYGKAVTEVVAEDAKQSLTGIQKGICQPKLACVPIGGVINLAKNGELIAPRGTDLANNLNNAVNAFKDKSVNRSYNVKPSGSLQSEARKTLDINDVETTIDKVKNGKKLSHDEYKLMKKYSFKELVKVVEQIKDIKNTESEILASRKARYIPAKYRKSFGI